MTVTKGQHVSRFYSIALGRDNNFAARSDGLVAQSVSSPSVALWSIIYFNNSAASYVTNFSDGREGQIVKIFNLGSDVNLVPSSVMYLSDSSPLAQNDAIELVMHNNIWYDTGRTHNSTTPGVVVAAYGDSAPSVKNAKLLVLTTTAPLLIKGLSDGYSGQILTILKSTSSYNTITNGGTIFISDTAGSFVLNTSGSVTLVNYAGKWYLNEAPTTGIA